MIDPTVRHLCRRLQALEDAIAFRRARLTSPCPDCQDSARCDDHTCDLALLAGYADDVRTTVEAFDAASKSILGTHPGRVPAALHSPDSQADRVGCPGSYPPASGSISGRDLR